MKIPKNCWHHAFLVQICTKSCVGHTGGTYSAPPDHLAGLGGGAPGEGKEGGRGKGKKKGEERKGKGEEGMRGEAGDPQNFRWIDAFDL